MSALNTHNFRSEKVVGKFSQKKREGVQNIGEKH